MKIHHISDTHNQYDELLLPGGEILVHSGDATNRGHLDEILRFLNWYERQNYQHKIFVPGNHDWGFQHNESLFREECEKRGIILLINQALELDGVKFYGSPVQPWFYDWAFNVQRGPEIAKVWANIPEDTEVLITHGPPAKILDFVPGSRGGHVGCEDLWQRILHLEKLKLHLFGHIHYSRGAKLFHGVQFVNASAVDDRHNVMNGGFPWKIIKNEAENYEIEAKLPA